MVKGLYTAYTGMIEEQKRLDVLSNNLANASTSGYKKEGTTNASFARVLSLRIKDADDPGVNLSQGIGYIQMGDKVGETYTDYSQGSLKITDKSSDLAIAGDGWFAIEYTDKAGNTSIKYTRDGEFTVDQNGYLRTSDGDYVLNMNGALNSQGGIANYVQVDPLQDYTIDSQGNIFQQGVQVGTVGVVDFNSTDYITKYGENLYDLEDGGAVVAASDYQIEQGTLETSNVNVVDEMVDMITIQRAYEAGQKMIQAEDETLEMATSQVGRV